MTEITHHILIDNSPVGAAARNTIGGAPILRQGQAVPCCERCNKQLSLFLQFDIDPAFNLPFAAGSHFLLFACTECEDIPDWQYTNQDESVQESYGRVVDGFYSLCLNPLNEDERIGLDDQEIAVKSITFVATEDSAEENEFVGKTSDDYAFKVGGTPAWCNYAVNLTCRCGEPIKFLCQIPEGFDFDRPEGEEGKSYYSLFNGNFVYVMACTAQCSPHSLLVVVDG